MMLTALLLLLLFGSTLANVRYPIEASWFADKYSHQEWAESLDRFQSVGGNIVWQRGMTFRKIEPIDLKRDFNWIWCSVDGVHCVDHVYSNAEKMGGKIVHSLIYAYQENYLPENMIKCAQWDLRIDSSRVYYIVTVAHKLAGNASDWSCDIKDAVNGEIDVIFLHFDGIDSKEILMEQAENRSMQVYLGMPGIPMKDDNIFVVDNDLLDSFYQFCRRVFVDYSARYSKYSAFKGVYQISEIDLSNPDPSGLIPTYERLYPMAKELLPKNQNRFVTSPYPNLNILESGVNIELHVQSYKKLVRSGMDVVALQEGRGVSKTAYFWPWFQKSSKIADVDPLLLKIIDYKHPGKVNSSDVTFGDIYLGSTREIFAALTQATIDLRQEGYAIEFWANLEAFEFTRYDVCLPVDAIGNGMAERLDRTYKHRIDWGLMSQGALVDHIISFAWDYDYLCSTKSDSTPLYKEIIQDYDRPIVADVSILDAEILIRGFYLDHEKLKFVFHGFDQNGHQVSQFNITDFSIDPEHGSKTGKSYLLQEAKAAWKPISNIVTFCVSGYIPDSRTSYHEVCFQNNAIASQIK